MLRSSQQQADILRVHTGHMLLDVSYFCSRSHRIQHVHGAPHLRQKEMVPHIITAIPKAGFTTKSQPWITWSLRCQTLWNNLPSPASWASARKLAVSEKDVSVVQSSFRSDQQKVFLWWWISTWWKAVSVSCASPLRTMLSWSTKSRP